MTASAVYDAVEPIIVWRALYAALEEHQDDVMLRWIVTTLPQKDEEVTAVHLPVMLDHLLQSAKVKMARQPRKGLTDPRTATRW